MNIMECFGIKREKLVSAYGTEFVFDVDVGAWHKLNEDSSGSAFNDNSIYRDSRGDLQAKLTEHYFVTLLSRRGIPINVKGVDWELWDNVVMGRRIDIKSKRRNTNPCPYDYHVDASQTGHPCTHYVWADVFYNSKNEDIPVFFAFSGWLPKDEFMSRSTAFKAGDINGGFKEIKDCQKIAKALIRPMPELIGRMVSLCG